MPAADSTNTFTRLADGTTLLRQNDGSFRPIGSETDHARLGAMTENEIESLGANDPDHPALDDTFWASIDPDASPGSQKEAISIKIDEDVLRYFRRDGKGYRTRINAVLRRYVEAVREPR